ncbi:MAG TPA: hypothetical protein VMD03_10670 [Steroidobacteraceae bacterium]|nr:hypothetical protein [Steroidobacteraceae bacterium]
MSSAPRSRAPRGLLGALRHELILLVGGLAVGALAVPPLLWLAGARELGPYAGGGVLSIVTNFFRGLETGSFGFWIVAVGPYLMLTLLRALIGIARASLAAD